MKPEDLTEEQIALIVPTLFSYGHDREATADTCTLMESIAESNSCKDCHFHKENECTLSKTNKSYNVSIFLDKYPEYFI